MTSAVTRRGVEGRRPGRQAVTGSREETPEPAGTRPTDADPFASYYGQPIIRRPGWNTIDIVGYFFLGGLAGASSVLALVDRRLCAHGAARRAHLTAAAAAVASLPLLVHDLGRPKRFLNMLRVLKPTSPMNVGSWLLAAYVPVTIVAAGGHVTGGFRSLTRPAGWIAGGLGSAMSTYTAVLLADTAVPAWHDGSDELPFVFMGSSAMAAGGVAMSMAPARDSGAARRFGVAGAVVEVLATRQLHRRVGSVRPAYERGSAGTLSRIGRLLTVTGGSAALAGRRWERVGRLGGLALVAASLTTRLAVFRAGLASADDPRYVVEPQRRRADWSSHR